MTKVIYIGFDGLAYDQYSLERSFYLLTGKKAYNNEAEFIRFIDNCFGKSIKEYYPGTFDNFIKYGRKLDAISIYREKFNCGLAEAKEAVEKLMNNS